MTHCRPTPMPEIKAIDFYDRQSLNYLKTFVQSR